MTNFRYVRRFEYGSLVRGGSNVTQAGFAPITGYTEVDGIHAPPDSAVSAANVWARDGAVEPRWRLAQLGTNVPTPDVVNGVFLYHDLDGTAYALATSKDTVSYLNIAKSWTPLTYVSGTSNYPLSGGENDTFTGSVVYLSRTDQNLGVFTNSVDPLFVWGGPSDGTGFSTLTQAPIARDIASFDNRIVAWNIRELASASRYVTRVQWHVAGDPEDWDTTSIGAGFEDLLDARGEGTRIFALEDELVLATTRELWRGRRVGLPYVFQFSPLQRSRDLAVGIPYARAAIQTPLGIFWLGSDSNVYRYYAGQLTAVGTPIKDTLRTTLKSPEKAFFSFLAERGIVLLHYSVTDGAYPTRAFALSIEDGGWWPQTFTDQYVVAAPLEVFSSSATTWGGLVGTIGAQTLSWNDYLGRTVTQSNVLFSSNGTAANMSASAGSDLGATVEAYLQTGGIFTGDMTRQKYADEVRLDVHATSASSLSVAVSTNLGLAYGDTFEFPVSVQSQTTQLRHNFGVCGAYHTLRFRSEDTGWRLARVALRARDVGEVL